MASSTSPPAAVPVRKSRRRWYLLGFLFFLTATPVALYFLAGWQGDHEMAALLADLDADDPGWRWPDIIANLQPIPGEPNSVEQILKVHALSKRQGAFNPGPRWDSSNFVQNARLTCDQVEAAQFAFARCDPTLREEARKLKDMPFGRFQIPAEGNPFDFDFEDLQKSRAAVYVLQVDAALRAHDGDYDGAAESCQAILNTAGALQGYPILIGYLVHAAEQAIAVQAIERLLGQGTVSEPHLKKLQELLQREADDDSMRAAIRGERATAHQMYSNVRSGKTTISKILGGGVKKGTQDVSLGGRLVDAFPNVILKEYPDYLRTMNELAGVCKLEAGPRAEEMQKMEREIIARRNMLSRLLLPAVAKVGQASVRSQASLRCALVGVAAERYRVSHGAWPRALDDLVKDGLLAKVPSDPYDGQPLRWKRTPTGAMVYSVGADKTDNGGTINRNRPGTDGTDLGFELWDHPNMRSVPPPVQEELK